MYPIYKIENNLLRRAAVILHSPLILVAVLIGAFDGAVSIFREVFDGFRGAWRGE